MEITKVGKNWLVTDSLEDWRTDAVFPIFDDKSAYFARQIRAWPSGRVLDIGTGSGILAITAARWSRQVTAIDLQQRALRFAAFNAYVNGVAQHIKFFRSDGLSEVQGKFDLILFNPPFNPVPPGVTGKAFSHGGKDGTRMIRRVFASLPKHLEHRSRLQMISFSLGKAGRPLVFDLLQHYFSGRRPLVRYTHLYPPTRHRSVHYFQRIFGSSHGAWRRSMDRFPEIYYFFCTVDFDSLKPRFVLQGLPPHFPRGHYSGDRAARIRRLRKIYRGF